MSPGSRPPPKGGSGGGPREVIYEFTRVGDQMRVACVDSDSGAEAVVFGPASAPQVDLERLALNKLRYVMGQGGDKPHPDGRPGRLV